MTSSVADYAKLPWQSAQRDANPVKQYFALFAPMNITLRARPVCTQVA